AVCKADISLPLHDALPLSRAAGGGARRPQGAGPRRRQARGAGGGAARVTAAPAAAPPASTDVLAVGAGIAGSALAYELARRGVDCLLVEHERPGAGASGVPVALINPHRGRSARASAADLEGARAFWELTAALEREGGVSGARRSGVLRVPDQERQARAWRRL